MKYQPIPIPKNQTTSLSHPRTWLAMFFSLFSRKMASSSHRPVTALPAALASSMSGGSKNSPPHQQQQIAAEAESLRRCRRRHHHQRRPTNVEWPVGRRNRIKRICCRDIPVLPTQKTSRSAVCHAVAVAVAYDDDKNSHLGNEIVASRCCWCWCYCWPLTDSASLARTHTAYYHTPLTCQKQPEKMWNAIFVLMWPRGTVGRGVFGKKKVLAIFLPIFLAWRHWFGQKGGLAAGWENQHQF